MPPIIDRAKKMRERINNGESIDEVLTNYQKHRDEHKFQNEQEMKGWSDLRNQYHMKYKPNNEFHMNEAFGNEYNIHNAEETLGGGVYWDTKENDAYWSLSKWERLKLLVKEKVSSKQNMKELLMLNILFLLILIYYAKKKSKQIIIQIPFKFKKKDNK